MKGVIVNFRMARHHTRGNYMVVKPEGVSTRSEAEKLVGKKAVFKTETGREIKGEVTAAHGNSGAVRVRFERGMPGQSISQKVEIS